jgi:hypothetical protein
VESRILSSGYDLQQNNSKTKNIRFGGVKSLHCILWCHVSTIQQKGQEIFSNPGKVNIQQALCAVLQYRGGPKNSRLGKLVRKMKHGK